MRAIVAIAMLASASSGCSSKECVQKTSPAMHVLVTDETGTPICDATVQLVTPDGQSVDKATSATTPANAREACSYNIGYQPGRYRLFVSRAGYLEKDSDTFGVESTDDECGPRTRSETVALRKSI